MRHASLVIISLLFSSQLAHAQLVQQQKLVANNAVTSEQGGSVALSSDGNTAIVGGIGAPLPGTGAAWVWTRSDSMWTQQQKLLANDAVGGAAQGNSVALSSDGNTAIVGGPDDNNFIGAAWVWTRSNGAWTQQQKLVANDLVGPYGNQGFSVALSSDGNTAIVGGIVDALGIGAAWVWTRSNGAWTEQQKLVANNAVGSARQGWSVGLSSDGNTAIVGGPWDNSNTGAAWVWTRGNSTWTQQQKLLANDAVGGAEQGFSVALSSDGNTAIVGGPDDVPSTAERKLRLCLMRRYEDAPKGGGLR